MPHDSTWNIQKALYAALTQDPALTALLADGAGGVFDYVPQQSAFPYIIITALTSEPFDTMEGEGRDVAVTIESYSRYHGAAEIREIMAAVLDAVTAGLSVEGHAVILCREVSMDSTAEADGETRRGLQRFRIITEPV